jgi:hypothetical protein
MVVDLPLGLEGGFAVFWLQDLKAFEERSCAA